MKVKIAAVILAAAVFGVLCWGRPAMIAATGESETNSLFDGIKIVLDAGHGGIDGGVVGITTKTKEAEVNLLVTYKLKKLLEIVTLLILNLL